MPTEIRYVAFSQRELLEAVREYRERRGQPPLGGGLIQRVELAPAPGRALRLLIEAEGGTAEHALPSAELTEILVTYCLRHGIPLPRGATKWVQLGSGELALAGANAGVEPALEELLRDPIVQLVMRADRLEPAAIRRTLDAVRRRLPPPMDTGVGRPGAPGSGSRRGGAID